ncbi:MAG: glutathione S-transferase family protein [Arenimonas sp.]|nr:glutathione S-transferase family protein [Arenimonas sp.]MBP7916943.1 glutathione S-transferase family protein [Arenimonas sp.]
MSVYNLYIANKNYSSWSLRPWLLMTEQRIPFTERLIAFEESNHANFKAFAPNAKVPCLHDAGTTVWDSLAIMEYLAENHPGVWPEDPKARAWARSASAEMHAGFNGLRSHCSMNCGLRLRLRQIPENLSGDLQRLDELWIDGLSRFGGPFLAGAAFSAVDAFYAPVAFRIQTYNLPMSRASRAYADRLLALEGMRAWYEAALDEPWREVGHEREILAHAELVQDFRR